MSLPQSTNTEGWNEAAEKELNIVKGLFGMPEIFSNTEFSEISPKIAIWTKRKKLATAVFHKIVVYGDPKNEDLYCFFDYQLNKKISFHKTVSCSVIYDLGASKSREDVLFKLKGPISYNVQQKELTLYGRSFAECVGFLQMIILVANATNAKCTVKSLEDKNGWMNCVEYLQNLPKTQNLIKGKNSEVISEPNESKSKIIIMLAQLSTNLNQQPGNPVPIAN